MQNITALPKIMVAPNGARRDKSDHPALPITDAELIETACACAMAGAEGIHIHTRTADGAHLLDAGRYAALIAHLSDVLPGMYLQVTSEAAGVYSARDQQQMMRALQPRYVSVALREMVRSEADWTMATEFYQWATATGVQIQHILYTPEELAMFLNCVETNKIPADHVALQFVLGTYDGSEKSDPQNLGRFLDLLDAGPKELSCDWMLCAFGPEETACLTEAVREGGKARVGFENSLWNADGTRALDNAERVREVVTAINGL